MMDKPKEWNEAFDKKFFTPEEIEASDARVSAVQKEIDRERVIKGLECCIPMTLRNGLADCGNCPYDRKITIDGGITECCHDLMTDALALLKAQEPVEPIQDMIGDALFWVCGKCGHDITNSDWYCANCGRAVKWE